MEHISHPALVIARCSVYSPETNDSEDIDVLSCMYAVVMSTGSRRLVRVIIRSQVDIFLKSQDFRNPKSEFIASHIRRPAGSPPGEARPSGQNRCPQAFDQQASDKANVRGPGSLSASHVQHFGIAFVSRRRHPWIRYARLT